MPDQVLQYVRKEEKDEQANCIQHLDNSFHPWSCSFCSLQPPVCPHGVLLASFDSPLAVPETFDSPLPTPAPSPTPIPSPTSLPGPSKADQKALAYIAQHKDIPPQKLVVVTDHPTVYPNLGRKFQVVTILDTRSEGRFYSLLVGHRGILFYDSCGRVHLSLFQCRGWSIHPDCCLLVGSSRLPGE